MNAEDFFDLQVLLHREREPRVMRPRMDPMATMSEREFKGHFRFRGEYRLLFIFRPFTVNTTFKGKLSSKITFSCRKFFYFNF